MNRPFTTTPTTPTALLERAFDEMRQAERCAEKAKRRRATLRISVVGDHDQRHAARGQAPPTEAFIDSVLDKRCGQDPYWKSKVGGNQWHMAQATMYANLAHAAALIDPRRT